MKKSAAVVAVFAKPYEVWTRRKTIIEEAVEFHNRHGIPLVETLDLKDKIVEVVSTHIDAAVRIIRKRVDNGLEFHIDSALEESAEYKNLRELMPTDVPEPLSAYQSEFS